MVPGEMDMEGERVVEVGKGDPVLRPQRLTDDDLVDVIKLIPILVPVITSQSINQSHSSRNDLMVKVVIAGNGRHVRHTLPRFANLVDHMLYSTNYSNFTVAVCMKLFHLPNELLVFD